MYEENGLEIFVNIILFLIFFVLLITLSSNYSIMNLFWNEKKNLSCILQKVKKNYDKYNKEMIFNAMKRSEKRNKKKKELMKNKRIGDCVMVNKKIQVNQFDFLTVFDYDFLPYYYPSKKNKKLNFILERNEVIRVSKGIQTINYIVCNFKAVEGRIKIKFTESLDEYKEKKSDTVSNNSDNETSTNTSETDFNKSIDDDIKELEKIRKFKLIKKRMNSSPLYKRKKRRNNNQFLNLLGLSKYLQKFHYSLNITSIKLNKIECDCRDIDQSHKNLISLPIELLEHHTFQKLDLSNNLLSVMEVFSFKNLAILNLSNNHLYDLPHYFSSMHNLRELDVSNNKIQFFPLYLVGLIKLNISFNKIFVLPSMIKEKMKNLTYLDLRNNLLTLLPNSLLKMKKLNHLDLKDNFVMFQSKSLVIKYYIPDKSPLILKNFDEYSLKGNCSEVQMLYFDLLASELSYLKYLKLFEKLYITNNFCSSLSLNEKQKKLLIPDEIIQIIDFQKKFVSTIKNNGIYNVEEKFIPNLFINNLKMIEKCYVNYVMFHEISKMTFINLYEKDKEFTRKLRIKKSIAMAEGLDFENFISLPLHKLDQYDDLLSRFVKLYEKRIEFNSESIFELGKLALRKVKKLLNQEKDNIFTIDNKYKIQQIQKDLKIDDLYNPKRILIREGKLTLAPTKEIVDFKKRIFKRITPRIRRLNVKKNIADAYETIKDSFEKVLEKNATEVVSDLIHTRVVENSVIVYLFNDRLIYKYVKIRLFNKYNDYHISDIVDVISKEQKSKSFTLVMKNGDQVTFIAESVSEALVWTSSFLDGIKKKSNHNLFSLL